jgi:hypothetical protein
MYKAKCNIACGNQYFAKGKEYTKKEIDGLDINDFEVVNEVDIIVETPKSMTTENVKITKKTNKK